MSNNSQTEAPPLLAGLESPNGAKTSEPVPGKLKSGKAYIWVTWITGLLSGEKQCEFAAWFRARHRYTKLEDRDFNLAAWSSDHIALCDQRVKELFAEGWQVSRESQNAFRYHGRAAILAGKPDIVARKVVAGQVVEVRIEDGKTGRKRDADWWQVLCYLLAFPRCFSHEADVRLSGAVVYPTGRIDISVTELTPERRDAIYRLLREIGDSPEPYIGRVWQKVPSGSECGMCDIGPQDCDARLTDAAHESAVSTEF